VWFVEVGLVLAELDGFEEVDLVGTVFVGSELAGTSTGLVAADRIAAEPPAAAGLVVANLVHASEIDFASKLGSADALFGPSCRSAVLVGALDSTPGHPHSYTIHFLDMQCVCLSYARLILPPQHKGTVCWQIRNTSTVSFFDMQFVCLSYSKLNLPSQHKEMACWQTCVGDLPDLSIERRFVCACICTCAQRDREDIGERVSSTCAIVTTSACNSRGQ
jgi:hypothetical protein